MFLRFGLVLLFSQLEGGPECQGGYQSGPAGLGLGSLRILYAEWAGTAKNSLRHDATSALSGFY